MIAWKRYAYEIRNGCNKIRDIDLYFSNNGRCLLYWKKTNKKMHNSELFQHVETNNVIILLNLSNVINVQV